MYTFADVNPYPKSGPLLASVEAEGGWGSGRGGQKLPKICFERKMGKNCLLVQFTQLFRYAQCR
jgi:hypothetical protein